METARGKIEASVCNTVARFVREYLGSDPFDLRAHLMDDVILVRLRGELAPAETMLAQDRGRGRGDRGELVRELHTRLLDSGRTDLEAAVADVAGVAVKSILTDLSIKTGERVIVFILSGPPAASETRAVHG